MLILYFLPSNVEEPQIFNKAFLSQVSGTQQAWELLGAFLW